MDISQGEKVEAELDSMIRRSDERRRLTEGERLEEEAWEESCRAYNIKRQLELRSAWLQYHREAIQRQQANSEVIIAKHEQAIEALLGEREHEENGNGHK